MVIVTPPSDSLIEVPKDDAETVDTMLSALTVVMSDGVTATATSFSPIHVTVMSSAATPGRLTSRAAVTFSSVTFALDCSRRPFPPVSSRANVHCTCST